MKHDGLCTSCCNKAPGHGNDLSLKPVLSNASGMTGSHRRSCEQTADEKQIWQLSHAATDAGMVATDWAVHFLMLLESFCPIQCELPKTAMRGLHAHVAAPSHFHLHGGHAAEEVQACNMID